MLLQWNKRGWEVAKANKAGGSTVPIQCLWLLAASPDLLHSSLASSAPLRILSIINLLQGALYLGPMLNLQRPTRFWNSPIFVFKVTKRENPLQNPADVHTRLRAILTHLNSDIQDNTCHESPPHYATMNVSNIPQQMELLYVEKRRWCFWTFVEISFRGGNCWWPGGNSKIKFKRPSSVGRYFGQLSQKASSGVLVTM